MEIKDKKYYKLLKTFLKGIDGNVFLVGGAVLDCINDVRPKDYDLVCNPRKRDSLMSHLVEKGGFKYLYSSSTADTFVNELNQITIQILKTDVTKFDYTINQAEINVESGIVNNLDTVSFKSKKLIPTEHSFSGKLEARNCLSRVKKMESKGYSLPKETRESLERIVKISIFDRVKKLFNFTKTKES